MGCQICLHSYFWCVLHSVTERIRLQSLIKGMCCQRGAVGWFELSRWLLRYWRLKYLQKRWGTMATFSYTMKFTVLPFWGNINNRRSLKTYVCVFVLILFSVWVKQIVQIPMVCMLNILVDFKDFKDWSTATKYSPWSFTFVTDARHGWNLDHEILSTQISFWMEFSETMKYLPLKL